MIRQGWRVNNADLNDEAIVAADATDATEAIKAIKANVGNKADATKAANSNDANKANDADVSIKTPLLLPFSLTNILQSLQKWRDVLNFLT